MVKNHLKRLAASRNWNINRKEEKFIARPNPGAHPTEYGVPIVIVIRDILKFSRTRKETRDIILHKEVQVDGKKIKDHRYIVGLMDVVTFPKIKKSFRIVLNKKGKLDAIETKDSNLKICRIKNKYAAGKKFQIGLHDGRTLLTDKPYKVGDSLVIEVPSQKVKEHLKFDKKASILLRGGKHAGKIGVVESVEENKLIFKVDKDVFETVKKYAFVVGKEKPSINLK